MKEFKKFLNDSNLEQINIKLKSTRYGGMWTLNVGNNIILDLKDFESFEELRAEIDSQKEQIAERKYEKLKQDIRELTDQFTKE